MAQDANETGHGNSPAAWTAVVIMLVAFSIGTVAFFLDRPAIVWGSAGLLLVGLLVGYVMKRMGYGVGGSRLSQKARE